MLFTSHIFSFFNKVFQLLVVLKWSLPSFLLPSIIILLSLMTIKGGTSQACAACKYQRRRCTPDCLLAPYFPADQPKMFQNAHRLFGVANMTRTLKHIRDDQKDDAMASIKYESDMWERFPVNGCLSVLHLLNGEIDVCRSQISFVRSLIELARNDSYRCRVLENGANSTSGNIGIGFSGVDTDSSWLQFKQLSIDPNPRNYDIYHNGLMQNMVGYEINNTNFCDEGTSYEAEMKPLWAQQQQQLQQQSNHLIRIDDQDHRACLSQAKMATNKEIEEPYGSMISEALVVDDRQSYTEGNECDSSSGTSALKEARQSTISVKGASQNELKDAAAWFSLTSIKK